MYLGNDTHIAYSFEYALISVKNKQKKEDKVTADKYKNLKAHVQMTINQLLDEADNARKESESRAWSKKDRQYWWEECMRCETKAKKYQDKIDSWS